MTHAPGSSQVLVPDLQLAQYMVVQVEALSVMAVKEKKNTEYPRYNDSVCYWRFCCKIEFAVIKKRDMDPSKAWITNSFEQFF